VILCADVNKTFPIFFDLFQPNVGKWPTGLVPSVRRTWAEEGLKGITKGWVPTFYGYGAQGLFKVRQIKILQM